MKLNELFDNSVLDVKTLSPAEIAKKHGVSLDTILKQLRLGIKIEHEHTSDFEVAKEIALDHLNEFPDYYNRLKKAEEPMEEITRPDVRAIERKVDPEYDDFDIDVDLGANHFIDRLNDRRNNPEIKGNELEDTLRDTLLQNPDEFDEFTSGDEVVLRDRSTDINIPVIFKGKGTRGENTGREELDMTAKTIMRKPDFKAHQPKITAFEGSDEAQ